MKISINNYIGDELANKVYFLSKALAESKKINTLVEEENQRLKDILTSLMSQNKEDLNYVVSHSNDRLYTF